MNQIYVMLVLYLIIIVIIGIYSARRTKSSEDFLIAGRKLPLWIAAFSIAATLIGTGVTIGVGENAYKVGLSAILYPTLLALSLGLSMWIAASRFRKSSVYTVPELLSQHYGEGVRYILAVANTVKWIGPIGAQFLVGGVILTALTGWSLPLTITLSAVIIIGYTVFGGIWAVTLTDTLQTIIIYIGLSLVAVLTVSMYGDAFTMVRDLPPIYSTWTGVGIIPITAWVGAVISLAFIDQAWLQRSAAAKSPRDARIAGIIAAVIVLPIGFLSVYAGLLARVTMPDIDPRTAVPAVILDQFAPIVAGFFLAAIIAAAMSSSDSWIHSSATLMTKDIYVRLIKPEASDRRIRLVSMLVSVLLGFGGLAMALTWTGGIIALVFYTIVWGSSVYVGPLLVAWFSPKKIKPMAGLGIMIFIMVLGLVVLVSPKFIWGVHPVFSVSLIAYLVTLIVVILPWTSYKNRKPLNQ